MKKTALSYYNSTEIDSAETGYMYSEEISAMGGSCTCSTCSCCINWNVICDAHPDASQCN